MVLHHSIKTGNISSASAVVKMILVWMPGSTFLQCCVAEMPVIGGAINRLARKSAEQGVDHDTKRSL
jgi:hypothetical protein